MHRTCSCSHHNPSFAAVLLTVVVVVLFSCLVTGATSTTASTTADGTVQVGIEGSGMHRSMVITAMLKQQHKAPPARYPPMKEGAGPDRRRSFITTKGAASAEVWPLKFSFDMPSNMFLDIFEIPSFYTVRAHGGTSPKGIDLTAAVDINVTSRYPFDLEIPSFACPYRLNPVTLTLAVADEDLFLSLSGAVGATTTVWPILRLTIPIHWRYEQPFRSVEAKSVDGNGQGDNRGEGRVVDAPIAVDSSGGEGFVIRCIESIEGTAGGGGVDDDAPPPPIVLLGWEQRLTNSICMDVPVGDLSHLALVSYGTLILLFGGLAAVLLVLRLA